MTEIETTIWKFSYTEYSKTLSQMIDFSGQWRPYFLVPLNCYVRQIETLLRSAEIYLAEN